MPLLLRRRGVVDQRLANLGEDLLIRLRQELLLQPPQHADHFDAILRRQPLLALRSVLWREQAEPDLADLLALRPEPGELLEIAFALDLLPR